jgi:antitoxin VapB
MAFHITHPETDALAPQGRGAEEDRTDRGRATPLAHELDPEQGQPSLVHLGVQFCRDLRAKGVPQSGKPSDKVFRDSLYEGD